MKVKYYDLENKRVFITGGGSGIGASIVEHFCEQGSDVYFIDINVSESEKLIKEINLVLRNDEKSYYFRQHSRIDIDGNHKKINEGLSFYDNTGTSERARFLSSGAFLIGKTSSSVSTDGVELTSTGFTRATVNGDTVLQLNRRTSDGTIINFRKNGATVGSIGAAAGNLYIVSNDVGLNFAGGGDGIYPATTNGGQRDAAIDLGASTHRFKDLYLSGTANVGGLNINSAYTFPTADGSANQVLQTDGSGNLTFAASSGGGVSISNNANNRVLTGDGTNANAEANLTFDGSTLGVTGDISLPDNGKAMFGTSNDLRILHNGTNSVFSNFTGNIDFKNFADDSDIRFWSDDGAGNSAIYFRLDGSQATASQKITRWDDNSRIALGSTNDLQLYHDGTHSYIDNNKGALFNK